jgi:hypothetical protein
MDIKMPPGIAAKYEYRGYDGGNELLPKKSGHYWMNGYAMWRADRIDKEENMTARRRNNKWVWVDVSKG